MKKKDAARESILTTNHLRPSDVRRIDKHYLRMINEIEDYAIIMLDKNGIVLNWNKGAEKIKGYTKEEIVGKSFVEFYPPEDREKGIPQQMLNKAREHGKAVSEGWRLRKAGQRFWGNIVMTALQDEEGNVIGFSKVTRDLTEKKAAEDKLREYSKTLEFQNTELEEFAYATSHDMKEPLRKIHLYNSYVLENDANVLDSKSREFLNRSVEAIRRMTRLIDDLLAYSKATSHLENQQKVDLGKVVAELLAPQKEELEQRGVTVRAGKLPVIKAIPFQCKQLMDNLISNAVKYKHPEREGIIRVDCKIVTGSEITGEKAEPKKQYYKITVADNGVGFESANNKKVFEVFERLHNLPGAWGSGIGLAICKKIMQNHMGFISAKGKPGEGACFNLYFPAS